MTQTEYVFYIEDAKYYPETSIYEFNYPNVWRNTYKMDLYMGIRSIRLVPSTREINIMNIELRNKLNTPYYLDLYLTLNSNQTLNEFNKTISEELSQKYSIYKMNIDEQRIETDDKISIDYRINDFKMRYFNSTNEIRMYIGTNNKDKFIKFCVNGDSCYDSYVSTDFLNITNTDQLLYQTIAMYQNNLLQKDFNIDVFLKKYPNVSVVFNDDNIGIKRISFYNVWSRENILIESSIVDLTNRQYIGYSNMNYIPIKLYPIKYSDNKFQCRFYDSNNRKTIIKLPNDNKDSLFIEAIAFADK